MRPMGFRTDHGALNWDVVMQMAVGVGVGVGVGDEAVASFKSSPVNVVFDLAATDKAPYRQQKGYCFHRFRSSWM